MLLHHVCYKSSEILIVRSPFEIPYGIFVSENYTVAMNKALSKAERTRSFIIESTAEVFNKKGYAGTSLTDLTNATKLTKGSIYGNFVNKEEVAVAVFDYNCSRIFHLIQRKVSRAVTFYDKLMVYIHVYKELIRSYPDQGGCPILNTAVEADDTNVLLKEKAAAAVWGWKDSLAELIESGIRTGEFKKDINITQVSLSIMALIEGGMMITRVTGDLANMDAILDTVELIIGGMRI